MAHHHAAPPEKTKPTDPLPGAEGWRVMAPSPSTALSPGAHPLAVTAIMVGGARSAFVACPVAR